MLLQQINQPLQVVWVHEVATERELILQLQQCIHTPPAVTSFRIGSKVLTSSTRLHELIAGDTVKVHLRLLGGTNGLDTPLSHTASSSARLNYDAHAETPSPGRTTRSGRHRRRRDAIRTSQLWLRVGGPSSFYSSIQESRQEGDIKGIYSQALHDVRLMYLNVNGLRQSNLDVILTQMMLQSIDIVVCLDARVGLRQGQFFGKYARGVLGVGTRTMCSTQDEKLWSRFTSGLEPGGQFIIVGPRCGTSVTDFKSDWTGLGMVTQFHISTGVDKALVLGTYWPFLHPDEAAPHSLYQRAKNQLIRTKEKLSLDPREFAQRVAQTWIDSHEKTYAGGVIVGGDFNSKWVTWTSRSTDTLGIWACENGLFNPGLTLVKEGNKMADFVTRFRRTRPAPVASQAPLLAGSLVDHILIGG